MKKLLPRRFQTTLLVSVALFAAEAGEGAFNFRKLLTIDNTKVAGTADLVNFPVLVSLTDPNLRTTGNGGGVESASGFDIVFRGADGVTNLDHELELYDGVAGTLVAWVRIPILDYDDDTLFYLYYGDATIVSSQENPTAVWDAGYRAVWHLEEAVTDEATTGTHEDSTVNNRDGTQSRNDDVPGKIASAQDFDGTDHINLGTGFPALGATFTIEGWVWFDALAGNPTLFSRQDFTNLDYRVVVDPNLRIDISYDGTEPGDAEANAPAAVAIGQWYHFAAVKSATELRMYLNGASGAPTATAGTVNNNAANAVRMARRQDGGQALDGKLDEVRVSSIARSANWILTEYNNQNDVATFLQAGPQQAIGGCPPLGVTQTAGRITVGAPDYFEMVFDTATGGSIRELYDLAESPTRTAANDFAGGISDGIEALFNYHLQVAGTSYSTARDNESRVHLLEATPARVRVRQDASFEEKTTGAKLAGVRGVGDFSVYPAGRLAQRWRRRATQNVTYTSDDIDMSIHYHTNPPAPTMNTWTAFSDSGGAPFPHAPGNSDFMLTRIDEVGARTDFLHVIYKDWAILQGHLADATQVNFTTKATTEWVNPHWVHSSAGTTITAGSSETWDFVTYFKPTSFVDHNDVEVTRRSADYRSPDPLSVSAGAGWNENPADGDFFNESEAAYTLDFDMAAGLTFSMNGSVNRRFSPFFKIRQWRSLRETPVVTLDAAPLSAGADFKSDVKPISDADFADRIFFHTTLENFAAVTAPDIGNGTGATQNGITYVPARYGMGALFDSGTDSIIVPIVVAGQRNLEWDRGRIEFWYLPSSDHTDNAQHYLFDADNDGVDGGSRVRIKKEDAGFGNQLTVEVVDSSSVSHVLTIPATNYQWKAGHWVHVAMDWDSGNGALAAFLNDVPLASVPAYVPTPFAMEAESASGIIKIGNKITTCCFNADGIIDEFTIYNQRDPTPLAYGGLISNTREHLASPARNRTLPFATADSSRRGEYLFLGSDSKFRGLNIALQTPGVGATANLKWEYWNGTAWADLEAVTGFTDELNNLTELDGTIYWTADPPGWSEYSVNGGPDLYYVRAHLTSGSYSTSPVEGLIKTDILLFQHCGELTGAAQTFAFAVPTPTAVELAGFDATGFDGEVLLEWRTASELQNLGFHLYRASDPGGPYARITSAAIPGLGSSPSGASYRYRDRDVVNGLTYFYELEDIETTGKTERQGPVSATPRAGARPESPSPEETSSLITYGNPAASSYRIVDRGRNHVVLELRTEGFYAEPRDDGSVRLHLPDFDDDAGIPVRRAWVDAVAGRKVEIVSVRASEVQAFAGLRPSSATAPEIVAGRDGVVRLSRKRNGTGNHDHGRELFRSESARLVSVGFQGDVKKALVELAPLHWDPSTGRLLLARRLVVRLSFRGIEPSEGRGSRRVRQGLDRESELVAARLVATERGLHAVRYEDLFGRNRRAVQVRLSRQGVAVPYHVEPEAARFGPGSTLYFLSEGARANPYGTEAVYELRMDGSGVTMPVRSSPPRGDTLSSYRYRLEREEDRLYQAALLDAPDLWLWDLVFAPATKSYAFEVSGLASGSSHLSLWLQGTSDFPADPDHHVRAYVNGTLVAERSWDGKKAQEIETELMPGALREGENVLQIENVGDTEAAYSMVMIDRFAVEYPRTPAAVAGRVEGRFRRSGTAELRGLGAGALVIDVSEETPSWLQGAVPSPDGTLRFSADAGRTYLAVSPEAVRHPVIRKPLSTGLRNDRIGADYLVIGPASFLDAAKPLLEHRRAQGLAVLAVPIEDVDSEFGFGETTPGAIRDFIAYAYHAWRTPPRYVVLLGDASYDFKDNLGTGVQNRVRPWMVKTSYLWTASDPTYAAVNGDDILPDLAIGRLPAASIEEARRMVEKILAYESGEGSVGGPAVLVADNADAAGNFEADADAIAASLLAALDVKKIYLGRLGTTATRNEIVRAFDDGAALMSYLGHGGIHLWASENVLDITAVSSLSPQSRQPILLTMNCLNGYYHFPYFNSLAEELVKAEGKGAIAAVSPSGLSLNDPARLYHQALLREILGGGHRRLGDAILAAQSAYAATGAFPELLSIYHLLGDPALQLR